jgi:DNA-binding GntR family transcriptional regulator
MNRRRRLPAVASRAAAGKVPGGAAGGGGMTSGGTVSSVDLVYRQTRHAILAGDYPPGSPLRIRDLARHNGVSLIPVREALRLLEVEGFVDALPNRGSRVAPVSLEDMLDVYRIRLMLELEALRQACPRLTPTDVADAREINSRVTALMEQGDATYHVLHRQFHFALYDRSRSKWLLRLIGMLWDHTNRYRRLMAPRVDPRQSQREHEAILDAIARGDADGAVDALRRHLEHSRDLLHALYLSNDAAALTETVHD